MPELTAEDQGAILNLFQAYGDAWGRRDARGCAALYAADGDLIAADGEVCAGPDAVEAYYPGYRNLLPRNHVECGRATP